METLVNYPPHKIRTYIRDIFIAALEYVHSYSLDWFKSAVLNVPQDILTPVEKE